MNNKLLILCISIFALSNNMQADKEVVASNDDETAVKILINTGKCPNCHFESGTEFESWNLERVDLSGAVLERANLYDARLGGANFTDANLTDANLKMADLEGAIFVGAILEGASFGRADLADVNLTGANLNGAKLKKADNLESATIRDTQCNGKTSLPRGFCCKDGFIEKKS